jgi:Fur family ferric uptake transcriptional regulator
MNRREGRARAVVMHDGRGGLGAFRPLRWRLTHAAELVGMNQRAIVRAAHVLHREQVERAPHVAKQQQYRANRDDLWPEPRSEIARVRDLRHVTPNTLAELATVRQAKCTCVAGTKCTCVAGSAFLLCGGLRDPGKRGILHPMTTLARSEDDLRDILVARGLRVTEQRVVLLRELGRAKMPISHAELTERVARKGLDRATVYRNLQRLADAGVLVRAQLGDLVQRYELPRTATTEHAAHPHLLCTECGDVCCLPANTVKLSGEAARSAVADVQLRGRCVGCRS